MAKTLGQRDIDVDKAAEFLAMLWMDELCSAGAEVAATLNDVAAKRRGTR
jgi:hypothetical protein